MSVIIKKIYPGISLDDLENFIKPAVKGRFYQKAGRIRSIKIVSLIDRQGLEVERYALVTLCTDKIQKRLINRLNGQYLGYDKAVVAEYRDRLWQNEKRSKAEVSPSQFIEKRSGERRRLHLKKVVFAEKTWP